MPAAPIIAMRDVKFAWPRQSVPCIDVCQLDVYPGERVFIHGPSGSGKSTLLGLLGGVLVPQHGSIHVLGAELTGMAPSARDRFRSDHIGFLFQSFNLVPYLSVIDNVLLPCRFSSRRRAQVHAAGKSPRAQATALLHHLDIEPALLRVPVTALS